MLKTNDYKFWFVTGSQFLYGPEQLQHVEDDARDIVEKLNNSGKLPYPIEFKLVATTADNITKFMKDANYDDSVAGVITWMHTFRPLRTGFVGLNCCRNLCYIWQPNIWIIFRMTRLISII